MVKFSILIPDATVNYIKNPSVRYDTTDWNAAGATLTRTLAEAWFGVASLQVVTAGSVLREGAYYRVNALSGASSPITASAYVRGTGIVRLRLIDNPTGKQWFTQPFTLRSDRWTRLWVSGTITGSNDVRLYVETDEGSAKVRTFYVDGAQMELKAYPTTYCDGDMDGCRWSGVYHNSKSLRASDTRAGGRWVQLAGEEREQEDLYMTVAGGLGMPPLGNNVQSYALAAGGYFSNNKVDMRVITLSFHARHINLLKKKKTVSMRALHELRQFLIDAVKPDLTGGNEDIWFEYQGGDTPLYFRARYDGGLEGDWDIRNEWVNSFPLRLLAVSPFFEEDSQETQELDFQESFLTNNIFGRINGLWTHMNYGVNAYVKEMAIGARGEVYIVGNFSVINNNAAALNPLAPGAVAYWDGEKWVAIATSANSVINSIAVAPNGDVYAAGDFTTINGVAANYVARYNGSTWAALGTGLNLPCKTVRVAPNGDVIVGGTFTTAGGVSCARIARWDGTKWNRLGQYGGMNGNVECVSITVDGTTIYVGGAFTDQNGLAANALLRVAQYNMASGLFSAMGDGFNSDVNDIFVANSELVYAIGTFSSSGGGGVTLRSFAVWDGSSWTQLGSGLTQGAGKQGRGLSEKMDGTIVSGGPAIYGLNVTPYYGVLWNGTSLLPVDFQFIPPAGNMNLGAFTNRATDDIFIYTELQTSLNARMFCPGITTVNNPGSAEIAPVIYVRGPCFLRYLENQTSKKRIYLDMNIISIEEVVFDFGRGTIESLVRGSLFSSMLVGSDFGDFTLLPGDNIIAAFITNDVGAQMNIQVKPKHWSVDATG